MQSKFMHIIGIAILTVVLNPNSRGEGGGQTGPGMHDIYPNGGFKNPPLRDKSPKMKQDNTNSARFVCRGKAQAVPQGNGAAWVFEFDEDPTTDRDTGMGQSDRCNGPFKTQGDSVQKILDQVLTRKDLPPLLASMTIRETNDPGEPYQRTMTQVKLDCSEGTYKGSPTSIPSSVAIKKNEEGLVCEEIKGGSGGPLVLESFATAAIGPFKSKKDCMWAIQNNLCEPETVGRRTP